MSGLNLRKRKAPWMAHGAFPIAGYVCWKGVPRAVSGSYPQRLKPRDVGELFGTTKVVPFPIRAVTGKLHRSFAAKSAAQDDIPTLLAVHMRQHGRAPRDVSARRSCAPREIPPPPGESGGVRDDAI